MQDYLQLLRCPRCSGKIQHEGSGLLCTDCAQHYDIDDGIPLMFCPNDWAEGTRDVTEEVKAFYEETPFPNYDDFDSTASLAQKARQGRFARLLDEQVPPGARIIECGCGTGQLSQFLQLNNNHVLGVDMSIGSLKLALEHKRRNQLPRSAFAQMNIFDLAIKDRSFDVVISHGVLHHTFDARRAFAQVVRKVKPGGIVMVGLYNRYGRIPTWLRSKLIRVFGPRIDWVVRTRIRDARKADIWVKDQYYNPHETWHSIGEVLHWFEENDLDFLNCSPAILGTDGERAGSLFERTSPGSRYQRVVTQLAWIGSIGREGALFDLVGRKRT